MISLVSDFSKAAGSVVSTAINLVKMVGRIPGTLLSTGGMLGLGIVGAADHFYNEGKARNSVFNWGKKAINFLKEVDYGGLINSFKSAATKVTNVAKKGWEFVEPLVNRENKSPSVTTPAPTPD
jgi:hypothetical protein